MTKQQAVIVLRGGGDLASGVALRLRRVGLPVLITEIPRPMAVRRLVSFCEAVYRGQTTVEGVTARLAENAAGALAMLTAGDIPVVVDPAGEICAAPELDVRAIVDARMLKRPPEPESPLGLPWKQVAPLFVGLGPGFVAGENCHAAIETNRGHFLGRVLWQGAPEADTGVPGAVTRFQGERVLRAPADGSLRNLCEIGAHVQAGEPIAEVAGEVVVAPFEGILRGLLHDGLAVQRGLKIGDVDPRLDKRLAMTVSEKSLAIGGGVLEALLTRPALRATLWS